MTKRYSWPLSSLQRRLLVYVVMPMLLISGVAISVGLQVASDESNERLKSDLELLGRAISLPISDALLNNDLSTVQANLDSVFNIGRVYGASVYNVYGQQVAEAGITETDLSNSQLALQTVQTGIKQDDYRRVEGRDVFSQFLPIVDRGGRIIGLLQINRRASDFDESFETLSQYAWLSWAAFGLITIAVLVFGHYRGVGRHVVALKDAMLRVAEGNRSTRVTPAGPSELQEVAQGFNRMLDSITEAEQELEQRREHEASLQQALREQEKMAAIGSVASGVAHELGAPLTVIDGRASRLLRNHKDEDSQRQLKAVRGQVQRLTGLVNQLLAFSRTPVQQRETISLRELIATAMTSIEFEQDKGSAKVVIKELVDVILKVDIKRLELALVNVLRNGLQAAESEVVVAAEYAGEGVIITIDDDGEGLPESMKDKALQPFETNKPQGKGTGLGLTIVKHVLNDHNGELSLANNPNGGCRVTLSLPAQCLRQAVIKGGSE
ncbi:signal transduction histidine kinase [Idiomarina loihiensis]|uniref:sensor histidine kinase n=1 Tax=Idiomarina TaxID=135575 RepID=UPI000D8B1C8F|nr:MULTISPECIES: HAMP domain-containing sensor histidine kinase [Idiomarina]PWW40207.1 signal transduction histidine kinase [Idiomarina loihiensis]TDP49898.1 signal transduction histidine kinase [Idiomarina loihiensis]TDS24750.1 signal transduction histidine kinase [Idiomarina sp. H2]